MTFEALMANATTKKQRRNILALEAAYALNEPITPRSSNKPILVKCYVVRSHWRKAPPNRKKVSRIKAKHLQLVGVRSA